MKGDFSRRTFDPHKHYSAVLQEQGRMLTDADLDEQGRIVAHRIEQEAADLIGGCGGPIGDAGFAISVSNGDLMIGAGHYYVDGILVENEDDVSYDEQRDLPRPPTTDEPDQLTPAWPLTEEGTWVAYLDVWRRLITAIDDPLIREVALGGPTTSAREKVVWQVRLALTGDDANCLDDLPDIPEITGTMAAQVDPEVAPVDPCEVPLTSGFKGLENQFYRVEIFDSGPALDLGGTAGSTLAITGFVQANQVELASTTGLGVGDTVVYGTGDGANMAEIGIAHVVEMSGNSITLSANLEPSALADNPWLRRAEATFVWSRDNGSMVTAVTAIEEDLITVRDTGPDDVRGFLPGQWVELTDDVRELDPAREGVRRILLRVIDVDHVAGTVQVRTPPADFDFDAVSHPKLRRWDGAGGISVNRPAGGDWQHIEDGIQISFIDAFYRSGDYWHFPARTATIAPDLGVIEWPVDENLDPLFLSPHGIKHHYCKIALFEVTPGGDEAFDVANITDCRNLFPPVTELTQLLYVGGDAQLGLLSNPTGGVSEEVLLSEPLQVRVANGSLPVQGATVQFTIIEGSGLLEEAGRIETDSNGIASCEWTLSGSPDVQRCRARLLDAAESELEHQVVEFHARLSKADFVSYDPSDCSYLAGRQVTSVQGAIDELCRQEGGGGGCCCVTVGREGEFQDLQDALHRLLEQGETDICFCLLPGDHELHLLEAAPHDQERDTHLTIKGCGPNTRIHLHGDILLVQFASVIFRDVAITAQEDIGINLHECERVEISSCQIRGSRGERALVVVRSASNLLIRDNTIESSQSRDVVPPIRVFEGIASLPGLFELDNPQEFRVRANELGAFFARANRNDRNGMAQIAESQMREVESSLTAAELLEYQRFIGELRSPITSAPAVAGILENLRLATRTRVPGIAIEISEDVGDEFEWRTPPQDAMRVLESNVILGSISLYGEADLEFREDFPQEDIEGRLRELGQGGQQFVFGGRGAFHLRGNRLQRLLLSREIIERLGELVEDPGRNRILYDNMFITDNVFEGMPSLILTEHLSMSGNDFNQAIQDQILVASVVADATVYSGNHGFRLPFASALVLARINNVSRVRAEAANPELVIV